MITPLRLRDFDHVAIRVRDLQRSEAFYCGILGCVVAARNDDAGIVHLRAGSKFIDLVLLTGRMGSVGGTEMVPAARNLHHICLSYEAYDVPTLFAFLDSNGIEHSERSQLNLGAEGEGESVYLADPDEHLVEIKAYAARGAV